MKYDTSVKIANFSIVISVILIIWLVIGGINMNLQADNFCKEIGYDRLQHFQENPFCIKITNDEIESIKLHKETTFIPFIQSTYEVIE